MAAEQQASGSRSKLMQALAEVIDWRTFSLANINRIPFAIRIKALVEFLRAHNVEDLETYKKQLELTFDLVRLERLIRVTEKETFMELMDAYQGDPHRMFLGISVLDRFLAQGGEALF